MPNLDAHVNKNIAIPARIADVIEEISDSDAGELFKSILHTFAYGDFCEPGSGPARVIYTLILEELRQLNKTMYE